jgi:hypothetical protein
MFKYLIPILTMLACSAFANDSDKPNKETHMVAMRDGVQLATDLYHDAEQTQTKPTILIRTVYDKNQTFGWNSVWAKLVEQGYVVLIQDIRGRFESQGVYKVGQGRREDGIDTLDWIVKQPWSNGKVGLSGCSYLGETQVILEATNHPALVVGQPQSPASGYYRPGRAWQSFGGGAFDLAQTAGWFAGSGAIERGTQFEFKKYLDIINTLPTISLLERSGAPDSDYEEWRNSEPDGEYFTSMDLVKAEDSVSVPNLFFDTWYDYGARETLMMAEQFRRTAKTENAKQQSLVIGPGTHCNFAQTAKDVSVGERPMKNAFLDFETMQLDWYNYWLKGEKNKALERPFLTYYLMGADKWKTADQWPLKNTKRTRWYLKENGELSLKADAKQSHKQFVYDPANPVPSLGGHSCCTGSDSEAGGYDQRENEARPDVMVYSTAPLSEGVEVTGTISATLFVSSSAVDTDFTVKLVDVYPTGEAYNVQEGIIRMRYRDSLKTPTLIKPGEVYKVEVDLNASSNYFGKGHQIRIEVSSSNFPRYERNLNTGERNSHGTTFIKATNSVWAGGEQASYIELPVISAR